MTGEGSCARHTRYLPAFANERSQDETEEAESCLMIVTHQHK